MGKSETSHKSSQQLSLYQRAVSNTRRTNTSASTDWLNGRHHTNTTLSMLGKHCKTLVAWTSSVKGAFFTIKPIFAHAMGSFAILSMFSELVDRVDPERPLGANKSAGQIFLRQEELKGRLIQYKRLSRRANYIVNTIHRGSTDSFSAQTVLPAAMISLAWTPRFWFYGHFNESSIRSLSQNFCYKKLLNHLKITLKFSYFHPIFFWPRGF